MKKKILYIILAFFAMGCDLNIGPEQPVITDIQPPEPVIVKHAPKEVVPLVGKPVLSEPLPTPETSFPAAEEPDVEEINEDEQIQQMIAEKIKATYEAHRALIIAFLIKWISILFGAVLCLYWIVRLLNLLSPYKLGFTVVWIGLAIISIVCVVWLL